MDALIIVAAGGVGRRLLTLLTHTVTTSPNRIRNSSPPERIRPLPCHGRVGTIRQRSRDKTERTARHRLGVPKSARAGQASGQSGPAQR